MWATSVEHKDIPTSQDMSRLGAARLALAALQRSGAEACTAGGQARKLHVTVVPLVQAPSRAAAQRAWQRAGSTPQSGLLTGCRRWTTGLQSIRRTSQLGLQRAARVRSHMVAARHSGAWPAARALSTTPMVRAGAPKKGAKEQDPTAGKGAGVEEEEVSLSALMSSAQAMHLFNKYGRTAVVVYIPLYGQFRAGWRPGSCWACRPAFRKNTTACSWWLAPCPCSSHPVTPAQDLR